MDSYISLRKKYIDDAHRIKYNFKSMHDKEIEAGIKFLKIVEKVRKELPLSFHLNARSEKAIVEGSTLYSILKQMPKGSLHHTHIICHPKADRYVSLVQKYPIYMNQETKQINLFYGLPPDEKWVKLADLRAKSDNIEQFDQKLRESFYMTESDRLGETFSNFNFKIMNRVSIDKYRELAQDLIHNSCIDAIDDGIMNLQIKDFIGMILHEDGKPITLEEQIEIYTKSIENAKKIDPHFSLSIILQGRRIWDTDILKNYLDKAYEAKKKYPDLIIGFDLVDDESKKKAKDFAEILYDHQKIQQEEMIDFPYILHGGECIEEHNDNLIDLLLLKCPRVGHGINLIKHSHLFEDYRRQNICIEANPLSNQIMNYVGDLRYHPLKTFLNYGLKVSINSDDDGIFETSFLTWDFFVCAVSMEFNLFDFKKVCQFSIEHSCLGNDRIEAMFKIWESRWQSFINDLLIADILF